MDIYIVKTQDMEHTIKDKEPYKSFLREYAVVKDGDMEHRDICIDLSQDQFPTDGAFHIDRYYFSNPLCRFSYFNVRDKEKVMDKYLICHALDFEFSADFSDTVAVNLHEIKSKQQYIYLPGVDEFEISYSIEYEKATLKLNAVISKRELLEEVSMLLISLDVALLVKGW